MSSSYGEFPAATKPLGTPPPSEPSPREPSESEPPLPTFNWHRNVQLFAATVVSVFFVGQAWTAKEGMTLLQSFASAWKFAVPLLSILVAHEFGHYFAARIHRVPASLPYFLPMPILNPFGTLGAVIIMPRRIRSANALLDIGAAGPLAGMVVAVPIMLYGLSLSELGPRSAMDYMQEGQSLLYWLLKWSVFGPIPANMDVYLHPTAMAAWGGFLVTFLNLVPFGQLDGGHVAFALLGEKQNRLARLVIHVPLVLLAYNFGVYVWPILAQGFSRGFGTLQGHWIMTILSSLLPWLILVLLLRVMRRYVGGGHPPVDDSTLSPMRKAVAVFTLLLLVALFMPAPLVTF